jgi:predicted permease
MLRTLRRLYDVHPGFQADGVMVLRPAPPEFRYRDAAAMTRFYTLVIERIRTLPGVESAAGIQLLPVTTGNWSFPVYPQGQDVAEGSSPPSANFRVITPGWFETLRIPKLQGRVIAASDKAGAPAAAVINRAFAERFWPGQDAIGKTVRIFSRTGEVFTVVGIVGDVHQNALNQPPRPEMYTNNEQLGWTVSLFLAVRFRDARDPMTHAAAVRDAVRAVDADAPIAQMDALQTVVGRSAATTRFLTALLLFFGCLAAALGAIGVYGVTAWAVARRTPEFGVRLALGASRAAVLLAATRRGLVPVAMGLSFGAAGALFAGRLLNQLLFQVSPRDPLTILAVTLLLATVALAALLAPAWRATRVDPTRALRSD